MPITTYIVDDETIARERLIYLIKKFLDGELKIIGQTAKPQKALTEIPKLSPGIVFLDVEMPEMSGLELAQQLMTKAFKGKIIFVTAFDHYVIKAIRANAFDYLLKPVDVDELKKVIERYNTSSGNSFNPDVLKHFDLSKREIELITLISKGLSSAEIATEMFLSKHTVDTHRRNILSKTETRNVVELLNLLRD